MPAPMAVMRFWISLFWSAVEARLLDIEEFAAQRQDRLRPPVAALFGRTTGGVTFDNVEFGFRGIALGAVGSLPGRPPPERADLRTVSRALRAASRARAALTDFSITLRASAPGFLVEILHDALVNDRGNDTFNLGVDQLVLGLRAEARVGHFTEITWTRPSRTSSPDSAGSLVLRDLVGLGVLVDAAGERGCGNR